MPKPLLSQGSLWLGRYGDPVMLAQVGYDVFALIDLVSGNRLFAPTADQEYIEKYLGTFTPISEVTITHVPE